MQSGSKMLHSVTEFNNHENYSIFNLFYFKTAQLHWQVSTFNLYILLSMFPQPSHLLVQLFLFIYFLIFQKLHFGVVFFSQDDDHHWANKKSLDAAGLKCDINRTILSKLTFPVQKFGLILDSRSLFPTKPSRDAKEKKGVYLEPLQARGWHPAGFLTPCC